jgi:transposase
MKYVGIDWASTSHVVALLDEGGQLADQWTVDHGSAGVSGLLERLGREGGPGAVLVAMEPGAPLILDQLLEAGYTLYAINPKQADRFRDRFGAAGAKDDRRDAQVLASAIRTDRERLAPLVRDAPLTEEIRLRDRARTMDVQERTRLSNRLAQVLARYFPALAGLGRSAHDPFLLALLKAFPDPERLRRATVPRLKRLVAEHRIRVFQAADLAQRFRLPVLTAPAYVVAACRDQALGLAKQLEVLNEQIAAADATLEALLARHPDRELLQSLPGLGSGLAARVVAELGDSRDRYPDASRLRAYAGTAPVTRSSGLRRCSITMRRGCNRTLQAALFMMARCSVQKSAWAQAYVEHARQGGMRYAQAVRALSNKWAKILWAVLQRRRPYDEQQHLAALWARQVPWAMSLKPAA